MKIRARLLLQWLSRRSIVLVTILLFAIAVLFVWFLSAGFFADATHAIIGIAAISALFAFLSAFANLLQAVEVQKQRQGQERPYVTAYFEGASNGAIYFAIENSGNSPAFDVNFQFNPSPVDHRNRPLNQVSLFARPISFLPPGKAYRQILDAGHRFLAEGKPTKFSVSVSYQSIYHEAYRETVEHDLDYLKQATLPTKTVEDHLDKISKELEDLVRILQSVRGLNSLLMETPDQYHSRVEREMRDDRDSKPQQS